MKALILICMGLLPLPLQATPLSTADGQTLAVLRKLDLSTRALREEEPQRLAQNADRVRKLPHSIQLNLDSRGWRKFNFIPLERDLTNQVIAYEYVFLAHLRSQGAFLLAHIKAGRLNYLWINDQTGASEWLDRIPYIASDEQ
ncbi:hypothetical protein ACFSM5_05845 [Lacibacterium aquatile]|uniref:Lipoprotein n=1 Tax=Lacibacterium aquatile TaxID=1168082 RepID=A0ABW5DPJ7_9PROT